MPSKTTKARERGVPVAKPAVIPVIQERAVVKKRVVETGRVRIRKHVREYEEHVDIPHIHEEIHIDRVPVDRVVESAPDVRTEGDVTIIPVVEERYVLEKRLVVVEELHVRRERKETHRPEVIRVMKEEVEVDRLPAGGDIPAGESGRKARAAKTR
ncbi:MAG TPA: YsnF/AvaK domain-containing protein [Pyrinomonadaceae bacterium]